jgi:hypothetical protein
LRRVSVSKDATSTGASKGFGSGGSVFGVFALGAFIWGAGLTFDAAFALGAPGVFAAEVGFFIAEAFFTAGLEDAAIFRSAFVSGALVAEVFGADALVGALVAGVLAVGVLGFGVLVAGVLVMAAFQTVFGHRLDVPHGRRQDN